MIDKNNIVKSIYQAKNIIKKQLIIILIFYASMSFLTVFHGKKVYGMEENKIKSPNNETDSGINIKELVTLDDFNFDEIQQVIDDGDYREINFRELIKNVMEGKSGTILVSSVEKNSKRILSDLSSLKMINIYIAIIIVFAGIANNFTAIYGKNDVNDISFYIFYTALIGMLIRYYSITSEMAEKVMETIINFMNALVPTFFLSVGITNQTSAIGFYKIAIMIIYFVENAFERIIIPAMKFYVLLIFSNEIGRENLLTNAINMLKSAIVMANKYLLGMVFGINIIHGMIMPGIDIMKSSITRKLTSIIPMVGDGRDYILNLFFNSAIIIKNSIGVSSIIILALLCLAPIIKMSLSVFMLKICAAVMQPVADKKLINCISKTSDALALLLKSVVTIIIIFIITIAIVCYVTNRW